MSESPQTVSSSTEEEAPAAPPDEHAENLVKLGPTVSSELEALRADVDSARKLIAEYESVIAAKDGETTKLKALFEKARQHLIQLQVSVNQLREERHRLANQAMEADALRAKLTIVTVERDRLRQEMMGRVRWRD